MKVAKYWSCQKPKMAKFMTTGLLNAIPKDVWVDKAFRGIEKFCTSKVYQNTILTMTPLTDAEK
jgi:hypothetical protein